MKKLLLVGAMALVASIGFADSFVTINKVEVASPWVGAKGTITVGYTLGGLDSRFEYRVTFDVTAKNETMSVTNDWAKLTDGAATKAIDTAALFGRETIDKDAEVSITLIKKIPAGQLWEDGPIWTDANLGDSEVLDHPEYGALYKFDEVDAAIKELLGEGWRAPSKDDFTKLIDSSCCTWTWDDVRKGWTFTGKDSYSLNSVFFPAAGYNRGNGRSVAGDYGHYWSSAVRSSTDAWNLYFNGRNVFVYGNDRSYGASVRAVRDDPDGVVNVSELVVATAKTAFWLGPGSEGCPWTVGEGVTAYVKDRVLYFKGAGELSDRIAEDAPWGPYADILEGVYLLRTITVPASVAATLPISVAGEPPAPVPPTGAVTSWEALTNAVATAESGAEITVGADITEAGGELVIPADKAVTIKLYGKTVTCRCVTVGGALTVGDADDSVGRIVATNGAKIAKSGSVTLLNGPMRGTFTTLSPGLMLLFK